MTQQKFMLDDYWPGQLVIARRAIADNPLSKVDSSAKANEMGRIDDVDRCCGLIMVDFGKGSIACTPEELFP